ncbi:MAG TPA: septum formation initiator family protein [Candidatus Paceibacterota bacterium]|nr:septum formation initiator family protein [Candidatus Paceibacterota bacterium]
MAAIQGKKKKRRYLIGLPMAILAVLVLLIFVRAAWKMYQRDALSRDNLKMAEEQLAALKAREADLQTKIKALETPRGIEEEIRANFSVAKEGEKVISLVEEEATTTATTTEKKPWWRLF